MTSEEVKQNILILMKSLNELSMKDIINDRDKIMTSLDSLKLLLIDFDAIIKPKRKDMYIKLDERKK